MAKVRSDQPQREAGLLQSRMQPGPPALLPPALPLLPLPPLLPPSSGQGRETIQSGAPQLWTWGRVSEDAWVSTSHLPGSLPVVPAVESALLCCRLSSHRHLLREARPWP